MKTRAILLVVLAAGMLPAIAKADYPHVVVPGETLTSIAETDGLSIDALAQANGISPDAELTIGQVVEIPPQIPYAQTSTAATTTASSAGPYDTAEDTTSDAQSGGDEEVIGQTPQSETPDPTDEFVSGSEIADVAEQYGVDPAFAEAIAWQESGWNNDEVSSVGAVGVMQIIPSTWAWIDEYLTPGNPLATESADDNIRGGVLLLSDLLKLTGGSYSMSAAAYYQGLASVEAHGMYPSTRRYVDDVLALQERLGG